MAKDTEKLIRQLLLISYLMAERRPVTAQEIWRDVEAYSAMNEAAIVRRKTIVCDSFTMERGELGTRRVDPYQLLFQGGQFYLVGYSHERKAIRVFRLSRIQGKVGYATKAEHDFQRPADFDPRAYANRIDWQFGEPIGTGEVWIGRRID